MSSWPRRNINYHRPRRHPTTNGRHKRSADTRRESRIDANSTWYHINRVVRHRRKLDTDPAYRSKMALDGWIRRLRIGQHISTGSWSPTSAHDTPEEHGLMTLLDFKSLVMAQAADLMETYTTPATTAEEQAERRMNVYLICLPAYSEWDCEFHPGAARRRQEG